MCSENLLLCLKHNKKNKLFKKIQHEKSIFSHIGFIIPCQFFFLHLFLSNLKSIKREKNINLPNGIQDYVIIYSLFFFLKKIHAIS